MLTATAPCADYSLTFYIIAKDARFDKCFFLRFLDTFDILSKFMTQSLVRENL